MRQIAHSQIGQLSFEHYNIVVFDKHHNKFVLIDDCEIVDDTAPMSYVATYTRM